MTHMINRGMSCLSVLRHMDEPIAVEQKVMYILRFYFHVKELNTGDLQYLFIEHADLLTNKKINLRNDVLDLLTYKSVLYYIARDFPELNDLILYSPFMKQLDDIIDMWSADNLPLRNYAQLHDVRTTSKGVPKLPAFSVPKTHIWWTVIEGLESINRIPIDICRAQYQKAVAASSASCHSYMKLNIAHGYRKRAEISLKDAEEEETASEKALSDTSQDLREAELLRKMAESQLQYNKAQIVTEHARKARNSAFYLNEKAHNQTVRAKEEVEQAEAELNYRYIVRHICIEEYIIHTFIHLTHAIIYLKNRSTCT